MKLGYIAIDQYGNKILLADADKHPRGQLLDTLAATNCQKMYADKLDGSTKHTGYIVAGCCFKVLELHAWEQPD